MTEREKVQQIVDKYGDSYSQLSQNATNKELKTFMKFLADEANEKQRKVFGLDYHSTK